MKRIILAALGIALVGALAYGAVKTYVINPKTVASAEDLLELFYQSRKSLPPLPSPVSYREVANQIAEYRFDFITEPGWAFNHDGGTYYLSEKSKYNGKWNLPMELLAYEDLASGKVVLAGIPVSTKKLQSLAVVDAPEFAPLDEKTPVESYLMKELWPRRVIWTAVLKPEADAWNDLLQAEQASSLAVSPMMMTMSAPEQLAGFRVVQDGTNLSVNLPVEFVGATVSLEKSTNLVEGAWSSVMQTNAQQSGTMFLTCANIPELVTTGSTTTNSTSCPDHTIPDVGCTNCTSTVTTNTTTQSGGVVFYRTSASSTVDSDGDELDNVSEYNLGTDYQDADSDGDMMPDGYEVSAGLDPLWASDGGLDSDGDGLVNSNEYVNRTDPFNDDVASPEVWISNVNAFYLP